MENEIVILKSNIRLEPSYVVFWRDMAIQTVKSTTEAEQTILHKIGCPKN